MNFDINAACLAAEGSRISRLPADNNAPAYISKNKLTTAEKFKERHLNDMRMRDDINFANYVRKDNNLLDLSTPIYNGNRRAENKNSHKMRSPQKQMPQIFANSAKNFMETRTTRDADVVVFDDIDVNWKSELNKRNVKVEKLRQKPQQQQGYNQYDEQYSQQCKIYQPQQEHQKGGINCNLMYHDNSQDNTGSTFKVTKMIGQLPIAEYEGSPRRIGNQKFEQNKILPKRAPGFPKRVSPSFATINQQQEQSPDNSLASQFKKLPFVKLVDINDDNNNNNNSNNNININNDNQHDVDENEEDYCSGAVGGELIKTLTAAATNNLYELSETRKVLEDFFKENRQTHKNISDFNESNMAMQRAYENYRALECEAQDAEEEKAKEDYIGQRLARLPQEDFYLYQNSPRKQPSSEFTCSEKYYGGLFIDTMSRSSGDFADTELEANLQHYPRNFTLSPTETTDYDSNCGDLDSSSNEINYVNECALKTSKINMLEDGLSSGHASDIEANVMDCTPSSNQDITKHNQQEMPDSKKYRVVNIMDAHSISDLVLEIDADNGKAAYQEKHNDEHHVACKPTTTEFSSKTKHRYENNSKISSKAASSVEMHRRWQSSTPTPCESIEIQEAMNEIRSALQRAKKQPDKLKLCDEVLPVSPDSPVWVPRKSPNKMQNNNNEVPDSNHSSKDNSTLEIINKLTSAIKERGDEEEGDTDLETDRLLGQLRVQDDEQIFFNDKTIWSKISRAGSTDVSPTTSDLTLHTNTHSLSYKKPLKLSSATIRQGEGTLLTPTSPSKASHNKYDKDVDEDDDDDHDIDDDHDDVDDDVNDVTAMTSPEKLQYSKSPTGSLKSIKDTVNNGRRKARNKEGLLDPLVLIEGVLFRARYLGSTQLVCEGQPTKTTRMSQAEEAVSRIKAPEGESQPSTEVDLFISTEKIMVLNTDLKEIMMDHALRTISYIADIGDLVVLMARRRFMPAESSCGENDHGGYQQQQTSNNDKKKEMGSSSADSTNINSSKHNNRTPKMICHVFESDEAQFIAQSIGQAFQVAYMEFLKANGIEDHSFVKEMDYQEVLNSQEIFGDELQIFAKKELQKEVVVPKIKGEILGVVVVESGWGSMLPTVVIANLMSTGAAARCGQLNIGDQLIAINGLSLVGLPLSTCQNYIRNAKYQTAVKFTVVPCPPVVEVKIKRPNTKYQLGFSVQNGVICSLLRGGIAERGGVRVGHRIIEINNQSVVAVPHEKIVNLLATSVGEILMKTMPTSMFRLLTGQETPIFI